MLEFLQGELYTKNLNYIVMKVGGWGCRLFVSTLTYEGLPGLHEEVMLYTYLHVREDEYNLYGFLKQEEKEIFTTMLAVSGIGPKLALSILSKIRVGDLKRVILSADTNTLTSVPGVGKKTAERIILELKDKIGKQELIDGVKLPGYEPENNARSEAIAGLLALGYSLGEAQNAVPFSEDSQTKPSAEELLRKALKQLAKY